MTFDPVPIGLVTVFLPTVEEFKQPRPAWAWTCRGIWWTYAEEDDVEQPEFFERSRSYQCIAPHRFQSSVEWSSVESAVRCENTDNGTTILFHGSFLRGSLACGKYRHRIDQVAIVFDPEETLFISFLSLFSIRIAPWQLLYRRVLEWRSRSHHSKHVVDCIENAVDACDVGTTIASSDEGSELHRYRWAEVLASLYAASEKELDREHICELELCISIVHSIAFRLGSVAMGNDFLSTGRKFCSEDRAIMRALDLALDQLVSWFHPNTHLDEVALRDFFEAQEESLCALEVMDLEYAGRKRVTSSRSTEKHLVTSLGRLCAVTTSLVRSSDVSERCYASRIPFGCSGQYKYLARNFDKLVQLEVESDEDERNKYCFLRECAAATCRSLVEDEPHYWYADLLHGMIQHEFISDELYRECLRETRRMLGEEYVTERLLECLMNVAEISVAYENRSKALELYRESLTVSREIYGSVDRSRIADILFEIGSLLVRDEDYEDAEKHLMACCNMRRRLVDEVDSYTLKSGLVLLADVFSELGSLNDAEAHYRESLAVLESIFGVGVDGYDVADVLFKLGQVVEKKDDLDEALHIFNECHSMRRRLFNEDDSLLVVEVLFALGRLQGDIGNLDEAELHCRECVDILRRSLGDDWETPYFALALHELAKIYRRKGNLAEASRAHREFFKFLHVNIGKSIYWRIEDGAECRSLSTRTLIMSRLSFDNLEDAARSLRDDLSTLQNGNDECHQPNLVLVMLQLGGCLMRKDDGGLIRKGEELIRESVSIVKEMKDNQVHHWLVSDDRWYELCCLEYIANQYRRNMATKNAERVLRERLNILREVSDEKKDSVDIADCLRRIGQQIQSESRRSEVRNLLYESLEMVRRISGDSADDFRLVGDALSDVVDFELENGTGENALSLCHDCMDSARRLHGDGVDHEDIAMCSKILGEIAMKERDLEDSERWYRMTWEMNQRLDGAVYNSYDLYQLGDLALACSRFDDAERLYREMFDGRTSGIDCAVTFQVLAHSLLVTGKKQEAERIILDCLKAYEDLDITKARYFDDQTIVYHAGLASPKCSDSYSFCLNFLELRKALLPNDHLHRGAVVVLLWLVGDAAYSNNSYNAERWAGECLGMVDQLFCGEEDHAFVSFVYFGLACSVGEEEAERLYRASLGIDRRLYGSNVTHADTAITLYALANLLLKQGVLSEAEELYRKFLKMHKELYGEIYGSVFPDPNDEVTIRVIFDLADAHLNQGSACNAEKLFRECIHLLRQADIDRMIYVDLGFVLQILASLLLDRGLLSEAKDLFCESRDMFSLVNVSWVTTMSRPKDRFLRVLMPSDECEREAYRASLNFHGLVLQDDGTVFILDALGNIAWDEGCHEDAGKFFQRSLMINRSVRYESKLQLLECLFCLAEVRRFEHSYEEAISLYREALEIYQEEYGDGYEYLEEVESIYFGLAHTLFEIGELDEAGKIFEERRTVIEATFRGEIKAWKVDYWQSRVAYEKGDIRAAERYIEGSRSVLDNDSDDLPTVLRMQATLALDQGELAEAEKYAWEGLSASRKRVREEPEKTEDLACALCIFARFEVAKGELEEAEESLRQAFELRRQMHGNEKDHASIAELLSLRAQVQLERGLTKEAVNTLEESLAMYRRVFRKTPNHCHVVRTQRKLDEWRDGAE